MKPVRTLFGCLVPLTLLALAGLWARDHVRRHPQDVPWTRLDLRDPPGRFTASKVAALGEDPAQCRSLLAQAGFGAPPAPALLISADCGYEDGVRLGARDGRTIAFEPQGLITSCPVAAGVALLEREVVQRAALRHFNQAVTSIDHAGSYSCRRLYGRSEGGYSEHATADALDITGFRLADGTRIAVLRDWKDEGPRGAFLREVRDGACGLFATVLSPDYNAAHADHLHLDMARRANFGWTMCR